MIARIFRATATPDGADAYETFFTEEVVPMLRSKDGHRGAYVLRRDADGRVEFQVITLWDSMEAVQGFSGPDHATAVVEPAAKAILSGFETVVTHHTVPIDTVRG